MMREKIGQVSIDWKEAAFGAGKNRRKTVGFGKYDKKERQYDDEFYIRELSIIDGGIGCALWDAAIIFTRWIYEFGPLIFKGKTVLELGAGVGLPGIAAARFAPTVYLSDYIQVLLDNLRYNIGLNTTMEEEQGEEKLKLKQHMKESAKVVYINWDDIEFIEQGKSLLSAEAVESATTASRSDDVKPEEKQNVLPKHVANIVLGSELTYTGSEVTIKNLVRNIEYYMAKGGVFIEVLSNDRDGVAQFCEAIGKAGYVVKIFDVPSDYMGNFNTKQRPENYRFYVFTRKEDEESELTQQVCGTFLSKQKK